MSMLTPPGLGGKYRITGNKYPRMRRGRRRSRIVLAVVASVVVLGLIGWGSLQLFDVFTGSGDSAVAKDGKKCEPGSSGAKAAGDSGAGAGTDVSPDGGRASASPGAPKAGKDVLKPGQITVNVLNATTRTGLAKHVSDELKKRGFKIGKVANATPQYDKKVKGAALLLGAKSAVTSALPVLGTQLADLDPRTDSRKGKAVDLIIGNGFKDLASRAAATKAMKALTHPAPPKRVSC